MIIPVLLFLILMAVVAPLATKGFLKKLVNAVVIAVSLSVILVTLNPPLLPADTPGCDSVPRAMFCPINANNTPTFPDQQPAQSTIADPVSSSGAMPHQPPNTPIDAPALDPALSQVIDKLCGDNAIQSEATAAPGYETPCRAIPSSCDKSLAASASQCFDHVIQARQSGNSLYVEQLCLFTSVDMSPSDPTLQKQIEKRCIDYLMH